MSEQKIIVPSTQNAEDWFSFIEESLKNVEGVDLLIVDLNSFLEKDESDDIYDF